MLLSRGATLGQFEVVSSLTEFVPEAAEAELDLDFHNAMGLSFDVSRDGKRFLVQKPSISLLDDRPIVVIEGWQAEVGRLVPED